jgi:Cupin-like domain
MSDTWRRWIAENLLLNVAREQILGQLVASGFPEFLASAEINKAAASPYLRGGVRLAQRAAKRDWLLETYAKLERLGGFGQQIPRVDAIAPEAFFRDFYAGHRPVILTGLIDRWPAMSLWSLDHFEATLGDPEIELQSGRDADPDYEANSVAHKKKARLREVLRMLRGDPTTNDFYITANNSEHNRRALAPLWREIGPLPGLLKPGAEGDAFFWMGPRGVVTPWHHDATNNLLVQIRGRKRVTLASSTQTPKMRNFRHCFSTFGGDAALAGAAEHERPATVVCDLHPGEMLFIPVGWWRHVEGLDLTIGLSFTGFARDNDFHTGSRSHGDV